MQHTSFATFGLAGLILVSGCSGGGGSPSYVAPGTTRSTASPTSAPAANSVLQTENIDGGPAFVTSSDLPVYTFDGDTTDKSNCAGGCLAAWPSVPPPAGVVLSAPWSSFTRSDNGEKQLAYDGAPLYTFTGDSPGVSAGNGTNGFSLARPLGSATAAPTATPSTAATATPSSAPTATPSAAPTATATGVPTATPGPTAAPTATPSGAPTATPTDKPTNYPY